MLSREARMGLPCTVTKTGLVCEEKRMRRATQLERSSLWVKVMGRIIPSASMIWRAAATPLTYLVVHYLKRTEGIDTYDHGTRFNPFAVTT